MPAKNGSYSFENNDVKIQYDFWAEKGKLAFEIFNKTNNPIYIDWKKSSFIYNSDKLNYWIEEENSVSTSLSSSYLYINSLKQTPNASSSEYTVQSSKKIKSERITFIPPKSKIKKCQFILNPDSLLTIDKKSPSSFLNINEKKKIKIYEKKFNEANSPFSFRNYLCYSKDEKFTSEAYIDNDFYVCRIWDVDRKYGSGNNTSFFVFLKPSPWSILVPNF